MTWLMRFEMTDRSPQFSLIQPDGKRPFLDRYGRPMKVGHRFDGEPQYPLFAKQIDWKKLCDMFNVIGFNCVSDRFRLIVEEFEPGTHQFFRISLADSSDKSYDTPYFIFNPCQLLDAYVGEKDRLIQRGDEAPYIGSYRATVSVPEVAGYHIWVGEFLGRNGIHISDALHRRFEEEKLHYASYVAMRESGVAWHPEEQMPTVLQWLEADPTRIQSLVERRPAWVRRHRPSWLL